MILNESMDRFVARSLASNLPIHLLNYPSGPHGFEVFDPTADARAAIRLVLDFLSVNLHDAAADGSEERVLS